MNHLGLDVHSSPGPIPTPKAVKVNAQVLRRLADR